MSLVDDLQKLEQLRSSGSLSQTEFEQAKRKLLATPPDEEDFAADDGDQRRFVSDDQEKRKYFSDPLDSGDESLGRAANRYVSFQIVSGIIGFILVLFFLFAVVLPNFHGGSHFPGGSVERIEWKR